MSNSPEVRSSPVTNDWLLKVGFVLGLASIAYFFGMISAIRQAPPYQSVRDAWLGLSAVFAQNDLLDSKWPAYLWNPTDRSEQGVTSYDAALASPGYTVFTSTHDGSAVLIDLDGHEVHRWEAPFRHVWPNATHVPTWVPEQFVHMRKAHVYPNGDLLAVYSTTANTPSGCGMAKINRYNETLWTYDGNAHHDFDVATDGTIYALTHRLQHPATGREELAGLSDTPLIEDLVTILSPDGEEQQTFSILDALLDSPYFRPILCHVDRYGDITHNNTIDVVGEGFASQHEGVTAGDLLVCLRNLGLLVVLNPSREQIVWATTGPWNHPHDPDPLENGNILIFDNYYVNGTTHGSAIVEFNPKTRNVAWLYEGSTQRPLRSDIRARQQLLPNGNVLVTDSDNGRLLEVTRSGEIAWEYLIAHRGGEHRDLIPVICGGHRYSDAELAFVGKLESGKTTTPLAQASPQ